MTNGPAYMAENKRMRAWPRRTAIAAMAVVLGACTTVTPYQPSENSRPGYADQQLESNKFRVTFEGNSSTDLATIENYVLYRAAEVTLESGADYFVVVDQSRDAERSFNSTGTVFGGGGFGRRGFFYGGGFRGGFGSTTATTRERRAYTVGVVIETFRGDKPAGNPSAFDARQLIDNLGPVLRRPA